MTLPIPNLDRGDIASPCSADWESMIGNDRVRFCNLCSRNVYNLSMMTKRNAEALVANTEGRLCVKFFRRADGTILTDDCPVGLRRVRRHISRFAGAAFGIALSLFSIPGSRAAAFGSQVQHKVAITIKRTTRTLNDSRAVVSGTIFDISGAVIADAKISLLNERTHETKSVQTSPEGTFELTFSDQGTYSLLVESPGFESYRKKKLEISLDENLKLEITLQIGTMGEYVILPTKTS